MLFLQLPSTPDGSHIVSGSGDTTLKIWDFKSGKCIRTLEGHTSSVLAVALTPDGSYIVSGSADETLKIWDFKSGRCIRTLEGHTDVVHAVALTPDGSHIVSEATYNTLKIWEISGSYSNSSTSVIQYINAKAVLLGNSGVGKSGLGIRIAEQKFQVTESTHGANFWHFPVQNIPNLSENIQAELTLWDLAGQPDYRLIHQLFMDDADVALILFDCSDPSNPFCGVPYWTKVLKKHAPSHAKRFLVSARSDVSPVTVSKPDVHEFMGKHGFDEYHITSAKKGEGIDELFKSLMKNIPWNELEKTSRPRLFQVIREYLLELKKNGTTIVEICTIHEDVQKRYTETSVKPEEIDTVISLQQSRGIVYRLDPSPDISFVLLKPELINQYASSIIQAARNHPAGIGAVPERDVLTGNIQFSGFDRLSKAEETLVLESTVEVLISHDLCIREMGYLVFPSQINIIKPQESKPHPRTEVSYFFSGSIETIYATLVVRLKYTSHFKLETQWKHAAEFSREGILLGFSMRQVEEGTGELEIYFDSVIDEFDRVTFIRFITDHLYQKGIEIQEQIHLYCSCGKEVTNRDAIEDRVTRGILDIPCQYCENKIGIPQSIEDYYHHHRDLIDKQQELRETVEKRTAAELDQYMEDKQQYTRDEDEFIHILHISDLHIEKEEEAQHYLTQLMTDLKEGLKINHLEYLVISGDIANHSTEDEYLAAYAMIDGLVKNLGLDPSRIVIVPGNHDLNWKISHNAYELIPEWEVPNPFPDDYIPYGNGEALKPDHQKLRNKFTYFSAFYNQIFNSPYPLDYSEQFHVIEKQEDRILIIGLNSCWNIDSRFKERSGIHKLAISNALNKILAGNYKNWLKIAVFHHPVTRIEMMENTDFMDLLSRNNFQICMHGHMHEAIEDYHKCDGKTGIHIVGAGRFGLHNQNCRMPTQYNLIKFNPKNGIITVFTRRKEKPDGAWVADARWGDTVNDPKVYYEIIVKGYQNPNS